MNDERNYLARNWKAIAIGVSLGLLAVLFYHSLSNQIPATY